MKTKFKTLTEEPEYKILKNKNFRNDQNYIRLNKSIIYFNEIFDLFELNIFTKIFGIYFIFSAILLFVMIYINQPLLLAIIAFFALIPYIQRIIISSRRKKLYSLIKISYNSDYYLIIKKIGGKIIKNFYK